jgi:hypothetical protein
LRWKDRLVATNLTSQPCVAIPPTTPRTRINENYPPTQLSDRTFHRPLITVALAPKPILTPSSHHTDTMGSSWNPFSTSPRRSSSYAGSSYSSTSRHHASTSRYKRSPRDGYLQHLYAKLRHFLREVWRYAQRHPYKVFFMVIMPLVSGGVLHKLARQFGVNLPEMGGAGTRGGYSGGGHSGGYYGSEGYGESRGGGGGGFGGIDMQTLAGGIGTAQSLAGGISSLASLAGMASKFM